MANCSKSDGRPSSVTRRVRKCTLTFGFLVGSLVACSGNLQLVAPMLPETYTDLTPGAGEACGFQLFGVIPIMSRSTLSRAYNRAVAAVPGARSLRDVTVSETWACDLPPRNWPA